MNGPPIFAPSRGSAPALRQAYVDCMGDRSREGLLVRIDLHRGIEVRVRHDGVVALAEVAWPEEDGPT